MFQCTYDFVIETVLKMDDSLISALTEIFTLCVLLFQQVTDIKKRTLAM